MKWKIISVGKPAFSWAREGVETYRKRLQPFTTVEMIPLKKSDPALFSRHIAGALVLALDERGKGFTTSEMARQVGLWEQEAVKEIAVLIGGSDGLPSEIRNQADHCFHLGPQTMMHELALLVWMEQLYRVHTLKADHPYHRA